MMPGANMSKQNFKNETSVKELDIVMLQEINTEWTKFRRRNKIASIAKKIIPYKRVILKALLNTEL